MAFVTKTNHKILFETLEPWLKLTNFHPTQDPFPKKKRIRLFFGFIMFYFPTIWFISNANDIGIFSSAVTDLVAFTLYFSQTLWLGYQIDKFRILIQEFGLAWTCCK